MKQKIINIGTNFILRTEEDGNGIIGVNGSILKIDSITVEIIKLLESGQSIDETSSFISVKYNAPLLEVQKDIIDLLHQPNLYIDITKPDLLDKLHG